MKATTLPRLVAGLGAVALWTLIAPTPAPAAPILLEFAESASGIFVGEIPCGVQFCSILPVPGETISLFAPPAGIWEHLDSPTGHIFNLLEPDGHTISDQVIVFACDGCSGPRVMFTSDPAQFDLGTPDLSTIEDGTEQFVGSYINNAGDTVNIYVVSEVDAVVPAPATLLLLGAGLTGLAETVWRRHRRV